MRNNRQIKDYQRESLRGSLWIGAPTLMVLIYMAFAIKDPSDFQLEVARFLAAVTAALLAYLVAGGITLNWEPVKGIAVSASTGFALFVLVAFVPQTNPFPTQAHYEARQVTGILMFSKSYEDHTLDFAPTAGSEGSVHLLVHPPDPTWSYVTPQKLQYTLTIYVDPRDLPRLQVESENFFPKAFVLTNGSHDEREDPYTVATDGNVITISPYMLTSKCHESGTRDCK